MARSVSSSVPQNTIDYECTLSSPSTTMDILIKFNFCFFYDAFLLLSKDGIDFSDGKMGVIQGGAKNGHLIKNA